MAVVQDWRAATKAANLWDQLFLDDEEVVCDFVEVGDADVGRDIDVKPKKGEDGATYTDNGIPPTKFTITLSWLTAEKASEAEALLETLDPRAKGSVARPIRIGHPKANEADIYLVLIQSISLPKIVNGLRVRTINCIEFREPEERGTGIGSASKPVGYGDTFDDDAEQVAEYYDRKGAGRDVGENGEPAIPGEMAEDYEAGRLTDEEYEEALAANELDRTDAMQDLALAHNEPSSQDNVDGNCFD
jgi:hypothetical protein